MTAVLIERRHDGAGKEYPLAGDATTIGRADDNDIVIDVTGASRRHAVIRTHGATHVLEDMDSKNGTWVNDLRVEGNANVSDGDVIRFGEAEFTFRVGTEATMTITSRPAIEREIVTVMFTDLQGHVELFERVGSEAVFEHLDAYVSAMKREVAQHAGRTVKTEGDGVIASFVGLRSAVDCAVAIQRASEKLGQRAGMRATPVRIGIDSGEAMKQGDDLIGLAVVKAARVMGVAAGGQIFLSDVSRALLGPATGIHIRSAGWHVLKGIARKERIFEVDWRGSLG
ncbi:MAG: adenylate/guanylate cyclase domain-containing protein [Chloroflexota bacterium]|nr:adenylate/guanylate cyclase domain-containing protein [Chloroflexota bacterium]